MVDEYTSSRDVAEKYDERYADSEQTLFKLDTAFIEEHLPENDGRLVDLGCGTGRHVIHFARQGWEVVGVDVNPHMIAEAARKRDALALPTCGEHVEPTCGERVESIVLHVGDMTRMQPGSWPACAAVLCMFNALEALKPDGQRRAVEVAYRLLRPGGVFIFQVHNGNVGEKVRKGGHKGEVSTLLHTLSEDDIRSLLKGAGFELQELRYIAPNRAEYMESEDAPRQAYGMIIAARRP